MSQLPGPSVANLHHTQVALERFLETLLPEDALRPSMQAALDDVRARLAALAAPPTSPPGS